MNSISDKTLILVSVSTCVEESAVEGKDEFAVVDELSEVSGTPVPKAVEELRSAVIRHNTECDVDKMGETVKNILGIA